MNQRMYYSEEARERAQREKGMIVLLMLTLGVGIGTALALLFAPKSGEDMRDDLMDAVNHRFSGIDDQLADLRKKIKERVPEIR